MRYFTIVLIAVFVIGLSACHEQATDNDLYNIKAAVPEKFDLSKMNMMVLNTSFNKVQHTMSILYGNKIAYGLLKNNQNELIKAKRWHW